MRLDIAAQSDIGRRKKANEDAFGVFREGMHGLRLFEEGALLCVADGLGGHEGGEIASKLAVSIVRDILKENPPSISDYGHHVDGNDEGMLPLLRSSIKRSNDSIFQTNKDLMRTKKPMGTTLLSAIISPKKVYIANVGDSRCYHLRDSEIIDRTEDHSWVDEQVKQGLMSKAEAETDRRRNIVTRCVGTHEDISVDTYRWNIVPGDMLLLCTDGLVNMVKDDEIKEMFRKYHSAAEIAQHLVQHANENGGKDNITVIVTHISPNPFRMLYLAAHSFLRRHGFTIGWIFFLIFYGVAWGLAGYCLHKYLPFAFF